MNTANHPDDRPEYILLWVVLVAAVDVLALAAIYLA